MNDLLVSIGLPVYNAEHYISEAIESILFQSYTNFELIIINDGSTDNTLNKINEFNDNRIKVISQNNQGLIISLNKSIVISNGKYYLRHDADDKSDKFRIEKLIKFITVNNLDYCGSFSYLWYPSLKKKIIYKLPEGEKDINNKLLSGVPGFVHPSCLFKKEILFEIGLYREGFLYMEDVDLFARLSKYKSKNFPEPLYYLRRDNVNSISESYSYIQFVNSKTYIELLLNSGIPNVELFYSKSKKNYESKKYKLSYLFRRYIRKSIILFYRNSLNMIMK